MEESRGAGANILLDRRLVIADRAGGEFRLDQIPYGGPPHHLAPTKHRARQPPQIFRLREILWKDPWMRRRIGTAQQNMPPAEGTPGTRHDCEPVSLGEKISETEPHTAASHQRRYHDNDPAMQPRWITSPN